MKPAVSVILPTYNRAESLMPSIMSVLNQSYRDFELIVVDDGSRQDVETVVKKIDDARVVFIRKDVNAGAGAARNTGLLAAQGEYIAFQDSDDLWLPGKLKRQMEMMHQLPADVGVVTGAKILYGRDERHVYGAGRVCYAPPAQGRIHLDEDQVSHLLRENRLSMQSSLFRRSCFPHLSWFDAHAKANEDWDFAIRLSQVSKIFEDAEPVVLGFVSEDSISRSHRKEAIGIIRIMKSNRNLLSSHPKQQSGMLISIGRQLRRSNKKTRGNRFIMRAISLDPSKLIDIATAGLRRMGRAVVPR